MTLPGRALNNVVNAENHLSGLTSRDQSLLLHAEGFSNSQFFHIGNFTAEHVDTCGCFSVENFGTEVGDNLSSVVPAVFGNGSGKGAKSTSVGLNSDGTLTGHRLGELVNSEGHTHLSVTATVDGLVVLAGSNQNADSVVEGTLSFIQNVLARAAKHNSASSVLGATREFDDLVFTDHNFFDRFASTEDVFLFWVVKGGKDGGTEDGGKAFNTVEVGVLNDHNAGISQKLFGVVVNKLPVDENIGLVCKDLIDLFLHLALLGFFELTNILDRVSAHLRAHNLNLVVVHGGVGNHHAAVFSTALATGRNGLFQNEAISNKRVGKSTTGLLDKLDIVHVAGVLEAQHGVDSQVGELLAIVKEQLRAESSEGNVLQVLAEFFLIIIVVHADVFENLLCDITSLAPALDNDLGMDFVLDQLFSFTEKLTSEDSNSGGAITDLLVLSLGDVNENASSWVVNVDGLKDGRAIIGDGDSLTGRSIAAH